MTFLKSFFAVLMMANYLWLAGIGGINRPQDDQGMFAVQTMELANYQECRYLRMDGLEAFAAEAFATRYSNTLDENSGHIYSIVTSIDAHSLPIHLSLHVTRAWSNVVICYFHAVAAPVKIALAVYCPPE